MIDPPLTYFDFMQFDQNVDSITWQVLTLLLQKVISYQSLAVQPSWGAKQSSINYEVLQNAWPNSEENIYWWKWCLGNIWDKIFRTIKFWFREKPWNISKFLNPSKTDLNVSPKWVLEFKTKISGTKIWHHFGFLKYFTIFDHLNTWKTNLNVTPTLALQFKTQISGTRFYLAPFCFNEKHEISWSSRKTPWKLIQIALINQFRNLIHKSVGHKHNQTFSYRKNHEILLIFDHLWIASKSN